MSQSDTGTVLGAVSTSNDGADPLHLRAPHPPDPVLGLVAGDAEPEAGAAASTGGDTQTRGRRAATTRRSLLHVVA